MKAQTIPQGSLVTPREPIAFGRAKAHPGQTFWVTCPVYNRPAAGCIKIARSGRNQAHAIALSFADFERFFAPVSDFTPDKGAAIETHMAIRYPNVI